MQKLSVAMIGALCTFGLSACSETANQGGSLQPSGSMTQLPAPASQMGNDGLSGSPDQFARMANPCIEQAARMRGLGQGQVVVTDQIRTGGGPLLTLDAAGTKLSCRLEDNGSVTVFSEYAN